MCIDTAIFYGHVVAAAVCRYLHLDALANPASAICSLVVVVVQVWLIAVRGQTIGKMILKIAIVDRVTNLPPGFLRAAVIRQMPGTLLGYMMPLFGWCYLMLDGVLIFSRDRRCLHDRFARTVVIEVADIPEPSAA